jgi:hypothetical protein
LLALATTWVKPYLPYLDYAINKDFIAQNLCENKAKPELQCKGKCHLKKEIEKVVEKENSTDKPSTNDKTDIKISTYISSSVNWSFNKSFDLILPKTAYISSNFKSKHKEISTPPPDLFSC